ncbi:peptidase [Kluyvera ascorbata]|uniref:Peptidase n=1 Tax=Kluyvera ascorbata TaxID=51288 RepID=A0A3N2S590_9ENTR|nr:peptidase [Kluyvera ascorbata]
MVMRFLTADYFLNRPGVHDHMLIIADCSNLDHLLSDGTDKNY